MFRKIRRKKKGIQNYQRMEDVLTEENRELNNVLSVIVRSGCPDSSGEPCFLYTQQTKVSDICY